MACCSKPTLSVRELLTGGLEPPFQLRNFSVASREVVRDPGKLRLQVAPLLCRLALELSLLPREAFPLGLQTNKLGLSGRLRLTHLLETPFGLGQLRCPQGQVLVSSADGLAGGCLLPSCLLQLTAQISHFLSPRQNGLLAPCNLLPHRDGALLRLLQLVLEFRQALRQRRNIAVQLGGPLRVGLQLLLGRGSLGLDVSPGLGELRQLLLLRLEVLQDNRVLCLRLLTGLGHLRQLLLGGLKRLLQGSKLSLKLVASLSGLCELLLRGLGRLLQGCQLRLSLLPRLCDLGQLLLRTCDPVFQVRQGSSCALLLIELSLQINLGLLQAGCLSAGFLHLV